MRSFLATAIAGDKTRNATPKKPFLADVSKEDFRFARLFSYSMRGHAKFIRFIHQRLHRVELFDRSDTFHKKDYFHV